MVFVEQLYTGCLAEAAYYIESNGEAAIVDPLRDITPYLVLAKSRKAKIKYILETHFHADFVSGHLELARETGATIVYGPKAKPAFFAHIAKDGEKLPLGNIYIEVLHTPGHTLESVCYLLYSENGKPYALFTGDTLFVGEVGRPDLAVKSNLTERDLASMLFDSLQRLKQLPDNVLIYPAHGPGSACGKNIGTEAFSTIGEQKLTNYAMKINNREQFIEAVLDGLNLVPPPQYFFIDAQINQQGYRPLEEVINNTLVPLTLEEFELLAQQPNTLILDTRSVEEFSESHIPNSLFIGLDGSFALWAGTLIPSNQKLLLICPENRERECITRLARIGYENILGYLAGGFKTWETAGKPCSTTPTIDAYELPSLISRPDHVILDVRKPLEAPTEYLPNSLNVNLQQLEESLPTLDKNKTYLVHCAKGYRSTIACSILERHQFPHFFNIRGGFEAIKKVPQISILSGSITK